jgi:hypothetical protein
LKRTDLLTPSATSIGAGRLSPNSTLPGGGAAAAAPSSAEIATSTAPGFQTQRRFIYHAQAMGLAGQVTSPSFETIDTQAASVLGTSGGYSSSRVGNFAHKDIVSFGAAYTEVRGSYDQSSGAYVTEVAATIENLNILNFLTVDLLSARMRSTFSDGASQSSIVPLDIQIVNVRLGGSPVSIQLNTAAFTDLDTFDKLQSRLKSDATFAAAQRLSPSSEIAVCTLATSVVSDTPGVQIEGNAIHVPQLGSVYLAELIFQPKLRTVGMFRIELGSPQAMAMRVSRNSPSSAQKGAMTGCHASSNGEFFP